MRMKINITALVLAACIFTQYLPVSASVLDTKTQVLTVEEAAKKAISNNTTIKNAADSESLSDENYRKALDNLYAATTDSAMLNAEVSLMTLEMDRSMNLKNIESQKENVEYNIKKYFNTIINAEKKAELYEESLDIQKRKLDISKVKLELGKMSEADYQKELDSYQKNLETQKSNQTAIDKAYRELNSYMGVSLDSKYSLSLDLEFKPMEEINLDQYIDTFINKSLTVQQAKDSLETARYKMDNYKESYNPETGVISDSYNEYDQLVVSFNQASRKLEDTKESVRTNIINSYSTLLESLDSIEAQQRDIDSAYKQLEILETKLELGKATQLEVDEQVYTIADKEETLRQAKNTYALNVIQFSSPNLLTSISGSSGGSGTTGGN